MSAHVIIRQAWPGHWGWFCDKRDCPGFLPVTYIQGYNGTAPTQPAALVRALDHCDRYAPENEATS